jgi:flagellar M-ring protein FliF
VQTILDFLRQTWTGVAEAWGQLSANARVQIGLAGALVSAFLVGVIFVGGAQSFIPLYNRLEPDEAGQIMAYLDDNGYAYSLADEGRVIKVPSKDLTKIRVAVADLGLPTNQSGGIGLEIFDTSSLMTNDRMQDVQYQRALNGIAQRQLNDMDYVRSSKVFISQAPQEFFARQQFRSEAAVTLDVTRALSDGEIAAVLQIVQSIGGHNLSANDITLVGDGKLLHKPTNDEFALLAADKYDFQSKIEAKLERKLLSAFARTGDDVIVHVSATLDWSTEDSTARLLGDPQTVSLLNSKSETTVHQAPPVGAPGVAANTPGGGAGIGEPTTKTKMTETVENSDMSETVTNISKPAGRLTATKIGILVDGTWEPVVDADGNDTGETEWVTPTPAKIAAIQQLALNTVPDGDAPPQISVTPYQFTIPTTLTAGLVVPPNWWQNSTVQLGGQLLLMLVAFLVVRSFMRGAMRPPEEVDEELEEVEEVDEEAERRKRVTEEVERLSRDEPEAVASLLRTWMTEE